MATRRQCMRFLWLNVETFLEDVHGWPTAAFGAFFMLLCHEMRYGSIPADTRQLARQVGMAESRFQHKIWPVFSDKFQPMPGRKGRLENYGLEQQRLAMTRGDEDAEPISVFSVVP